MFALSSKLLGSGLTHAARFTALVGAMTLCPLTVHADSLPTHGAVIHLNPFLSPGWFPVPGPFNALVAPGLASVQLGVDGLASPSLWHWENELDFVGLVGPMSVSVADGPPVVVMFGPGPDIYIEVHQPDTPAELGPFTKTLTNSAASTVSVAWGVSVTEDHQGGQQPGGTFSWNLPGGGVGSMPLPPLFLATSDMFIGFAGGTYEITFVPPPACPADLNGDGFVGGLDLAMLLAQWSGPAGYGPCPPFRPGDLNQDCRVDGLDLASQLAAWGPCP